MSENTLGFSGVVVICSPRVEEELLKNGWNQFVKNCPRIHDSNKQFYLDHVCFLGSFPEVLAADVYFRNDLEDIVIVSAESTKEIGEDIFEFLSLGLPVHSVAYPDFDLFPWFFQGEYVSR